MNKRGQFYIIAGIIIVAVIVGFVVITNYSKKSGYVIIEDLEKELKTESQKVIEYHATHPGNTLNQFGKDYSSYIGEDIKVYFIMGNNPNIEAYQYIKGVETQLTDPVIQEDKIIFTLDGIDYEFALVTGENFYYLLSQEIKGERFVVSG